MSSKDYVKCKYCSARYKKWYRTKSGKLSTPEKAFAKLANHIFEKHENKFACYNCDRAFNCSYAYNPLNLDKKAMTNCIPLQKGVHHG